MACPKCGCKVHYQYEGGGDDFDRWVDNLERCAACGHVFDIEDSADEEDEHEESSTVRCGLLDLRAADAARMGNEALANARGLEATVANCGGAVLVNVPRRSRLCDPTCAEESLGGKHCTTNCVALEIPPMDIGGAQPSSNNQPKDTK